MVRGPLPALLFFHALALSALGSPRSAQQAPSLEAVNAAIDRGVAYLLRSQNRDGSWGVDLNERGTTWHDLRDGPCALAVYTLRKCGVPADHPAIQRAVAFLLENMPHHTYATGMQLHALGALHDHDERMRQLLGLLLDLRQGGGWDYPTLGRPDLSNTQVAALGLRAAHAAGLSLPKTIWGELVQTVMRYQERPVAIPGAEELAKEKRRMAGFSYEPGGAPTASMTTAGLTILGIVTEDPDRVDHRFDAEIEEARQLGLNWLEQHYSVEGNPRGEPAWHFYYLYGLERVCAFNGLEKIGAHDWYQEGATQLLKEERADGGWWNDGRSRWPPTPLATADTCFALLFLRRATLSGVAPQRTSLHCAEDADSEVWVRVDAKQTWTMWISGFAPKVRESFAATGATGGMQPGLCVQRVEWWVGGERVETLAGDPARPWQDERYALRHKPAQSGELDVECRVTALGADGAARELRSRVQKVRSDLTLEPWMLEYARDAAKNLFELEELGLTASSEESEFHPKGDLLDGLQGSSWWAKEDDPEPWIRLELERGLRLREIWLSPAAASETLRKESLTFERIHLFLNDAKIPLVITLDPDWRLKTKFVLPKSTLVRSLELRIPDPPREKGKCVGLAEIEGR